MEICEDDLSPQLKAIADVIGLSATIALSRALGGRLIRFSPLSPPQEAVDVIGTELVEKLCQLFDREVIELNTIDRTEGRAIARYVHEASDQGLNTLQICRKLKIGRATVRSILKRRTQPPTTMKENKDEKVVQLNFFL